MFMAHTNHLSLVINTLVLKYLHVFSNMIQKYIGASFLLWQTYSLIHYILIVSSVWANCLLIYTTFHGIRPTFVFPILVNHRLIDYLICFLLDKTYFGQYKFYSTLSQKLKLFSVSVSYEFSMNNNTFRRETQTIIKNAERTEAI